MALPPPELAAQLPEVVLRFDSRRWRVRGLGRNLSFETLRVNVLVGLDAFAQLSRGLVCERDGEHLVRLGALDRRVQCHSSHTIVE